MIEHIKAVAVYVEDQGQALDFYTQQLGFEVRRNEPMGPRGNWVEVAPPGARTCLVLYPRSLMPSWKVLKPSLLFKCDDVEATCLELAAKGVRITEPPRALGWGTYARFADPDGNEFLLTTPKGG
jgi:predicted enzyme related to lactoylglutathione lyase